MARFCRAIKTCSLFYAEALTITTCSQKPHKFNEGTFVLIVCMNRLSANHDLLYHNLMANYDLV